MKIAVLAGGTGGARLASGFAAALPPGDVTVIANTADDDEFWGLLVSPDTDAILYRLCGMFNQQAGYGVTDDSFHALEMLGRMGEPTWFQLGDRDLGLHILRDSLRREGMSLVEAVAEIARRLGISSCVIPMSNDPVRTRIITDSGERSFQEWFVADRCEPRVRALKLHGIESAQPAPEALLATDGADIVVIGPSNPLISIDPITALLGSHLRRERVVAVSPIVAGRALKGPTVEMMLQLGESPTAVGVARHYSHTADHFVIDTADARLKPEIEDLGLRVHVMNTVMTDASSERLLATNLISEIEGRRSDV